MTMFKALAGLLAGVIMIGGASVARADAPLTIGVTAGPVALLLEQVAVRAKAKGIEVTLVEFSDWVTPNSAVAAGDLDANFFQHVTFLEQQNKARGSNLVPAAPGGIIGPVGLFSKKYKKVEDVKSGETVSIPNDPVNGARGLILLEKAGLVKLTPGKGIAVTAQDIVENPRKLKIVELESGQIYRSLDDVGLASVNFTSLVLGGGDPKSALVADLTTDEKFVFRFVTRPDRKDNPKLHAFIKEFKTPETRAFIETKLPAFIPAW
ncbi:MetQ/NlpA family ABC transporter substrate-binding protein [Enterovirga rhinocerotis]|uniref:D-methionine transport system substrate-binding protein n=1 Tax=Enterovirga rhinocerotis TaxID=1339210 RepID=A0A4R7BLH8_9HYPH|nr:MetQ/NlpA family ABC transporter substrate-binding protein [Enterovirga rhinocerotis]TDR85125.1 D-methionine transport system substrate-binding protein [Enterovirga rhinocerotis]